MDNFVNFLLDYYVWILAVLGVLIITVIGFLVDTNQKRKKKIKEQVQNTTVEEIKTVQNLEENKEAVPIVEAKNEQAPTNVDNVIGGNGYYEPVNNIAHQEQSQPTMAEQKVDTVNQTSNYNLGGMLPNNKNDEVLSMQKPHFESREVSYPSSNGISNVTPVQPVVEPKPVTPISINPVNQFGQPMQQPNLSQPINPQVATVSNQNAVRTVNPNGVMYNSQVNNGYMNAQPVQNQSVLVQQPSSNSQPTQTPTQPLNQTQVINTQPVQQAQQINQNVNGGMNFVTGNTVNSSDDMWKL